jgi:hypothetical protein
VPATDPARIVAVPATDPARIVAVPATDPARIVAVPAIAPPVTWGERASHSSRSDSTDRWPPFSNVGKGAVHQRRGGVEFTEVR